MQKQLDFSGVVSSEVSFPYAHFALPSYAEGTPCTRIHGHNARVVVSVVGVSTHETPFIVELGHLKDLIRQTTNLWDHRLLVHWTNEEASEFWASRSEEELTLLSLFGISEEGVIPLGHYSSSEALARRIAMDVLQRLVAEGSPCRTVSCTFYESPTNSVEVTVTAVQSPGKEINGGSKPVGI